MNTKLTWGGLVLASMFFIGCLPTLNPIYTDADLVFDRSLVGVWKQNDASWEFIRRDDTSYRLNHTDAQGRHGRFIAHLAKLGNLQVLDLTPIDLNPDQSGLQVFHELRIHTVYVVQQTKPDVELRAMDLGWLKTFLASHPSEVSYVVVDGKPILTASTKELQQFVLTHQDAFKARIKLTRNP